MSEFNDIGISRQLHRPRIRRLLTIGLAASALHCIGDLVLGWGAEDETLTGMMRLLSAFTAASDSGIFAAAMPGMLGMVLEGLSAFGNRPWVNAVNCAMVSIGSVWMFGGLLAGAKKAQTANEKAK